jgi:4-carboxymuconolactone decarboxylase
MTPRLEPPDAAHRDATLSDHLVRTRGWLPAVFEIGFHRPELLRRVAAVGEFFRFESVLDPQLRELCILGVADETDCAYEWVHHARSAAEIGVTQDLLDSVRTGSIENEPSVRGRAVRYARAIAAGGEIADADFTALHDDLGDAAIYELTILAGFYLLQARVVKALGVELEDSVAAAD